MVANNILRATGDAIFPSAVMIVATLVNIVLDPILIFGLGPIPAMGVEGAAWATLAARFAPLAGSLYLLHYRDRVLEFRIPPMAELRDCWRSIAVVALPAAMSNVINPLGYGILTAIVARFGADAVAGFGVATRIEALALVPIYALSVGIAPIAGQNWGAGKGERIRLALLQCFAAGTVWSVLLALSFWLFGAEIVGLFNPDPEIVRVAAGYLDIGPRISSRQASPFGNPGEFSFAPESICAGERRKGWTGPPMRASIPARGTHVVRASALMGFAASGRDR
jgi:Na+-driven multidrug efflux pump